MPTPAAIASLGERIAVGWSSMRISPSSGCISTYSTFIRVVLPALFSPSNALISAGWTTRSMWSLATRLPNRLVIPRSSSFTGCLREPAGQCLGLAGALTSSCDRYSAFDPWSDRALGRRLDLPADDVLLQRVDLSLHRGRHRG